jgi:hypothetical protein
MEWLDCFRNDKVLMLLPPNLLAQQRRASGSNIIISIIRRSRLQRGRIIPRIMPREWVMAG